MKALSWTLRAYVATVIAVAAAALAVAGVGAVGAATFDAAQLPSALILFAFAWLAQRQPIHLGPKTKVTVDTAPMFAAG